MLEGFRELGRALKGAGLFGRANRLERRGRLPEARVALLDALALVKAVPGESIHSPATFSTRLFAYLSMARLAIEMKDPAEAASYARRWLAGWSEYQLAVPEARRDRRFQALADWESLARKLLAWSETQQLQPTMKLEFVPLAETARSAGPLIRLHGRDGQVVAGLRRALAGLTDKPLALHAVRGIAQIDGCHVAAVRVSRGGGVKQLGPRSFLWEMDAAGCDQVIGLLEPFQNPGEQDRFQFLSSGSEATILISTDGSC